MSRFVQLSKVLINVDAIRLILPGVVKKKEGETTGCTVYFINSEVPFAYYGEDADKIITAARDRYLSTEESVQ